MNDNYGPDSVGWWVYYHTDGDWYLCHCDSVEQYVSELTWSGRSPQGEWTDHWLKLPNRKTNQ